MAQTFEEACKTNEALASHQQEIKQSRVGGLGGSDANMLYRIGLNGMAALTATDMKRLAVMMGKAEQQDWGGNAYTTAGHLFEDYVEREYIYGECGLAEQLTERGVGCHVEREALIEKKLARNFRTFAHADFKINNGVIECKFVQDTTEATRKKYAAQLQWYFILGADRVALCHGVGEVEPFNVEDAETIVVAYDEQIADTILNGVKILDKAIQSGWTPVILEKQSVEDAPAFIQRAFADYKRAAETEKAAKTEKETAAAVILQYFEGMGLLGITSEDSQVVYAKAGESRSFDSAKFLKEHPEFDDAKYYKITKRKASVSLK